MSQTEGREEAGARLVARRGIRVGGVQGQRLRGSTREQARDTVRRALRGPMETPTQEPKP